MFFPIVIFSLVGSALSADILAVFPHPGKTHFDVFEPLVLELAAKGHKLTVLSFFPQKTTVANVTDISLVDVMPIFMSAVPFEAVNGLNPVGNYMWTIDIGHESCKFVMQSQQVKSLIKSGKKFDLIIFEIFNTDCLFSLAEVFKAPYMGFSSCQAFPHHNLRISNPDNFHISSNVFFPMSRHMSFTERLTNTVVTIGMQLSWTYYYAKRDQEVVRSEAIKDVNLSEVTSKISLILVNSHYSIQGPRPTTPMFVEVGGLNIFPAKPLDKELNQYLNDSPEGVLLFSMGSVLQSSSFPADKRQAFMDAFSELKPLRVLMKWENDSLPGKPDNVRLSRWLPQRDVLAHPKVRAFMGHGGLLSTSEAVYEGVPMVLMPMFGDQPNNVAHLQSTGAAIKLGYDEVTKDNVLRALKAVLLDPSYKEKAKLLSERYRDRPMPPLDTAVYWTEYVIRHKGAPHLRSAAVDMPWYQLWLLDVIAALLASLAVTVYVTVWLTRSAITFIRRKVNLARGKKHGKRD